MTDIDPRAFGRGVLGPIFHLFCFRLHAHMAVYRGRDATALFVARGGLRLRHYFDLFLAAHGLTAPLPTGDALLSRMVAMKAGLLNAPDAMAAQIAAEYGGRSTGDALRCFLPEPVRQRWQEAAEPAAVTGPFGSAVLTEALSGRSGGGAILAAYAAEQNILLREHLAAACGGRAGALLLIDTGWSGSIVAALQAAIPKQAIRALFFGRYNYGGPPLPVFADIVGLMAEGIDYDPRRPLTTIFRHRHLIEGLCEVPWPSATGFVRDGQGRCRAETGAPPAEVIAPGPDEPMALGVADYLRAAEGRLDAARIVGAAAGAARRLQRAIRYPSPAEAPRLTVPVRSADFGKALVVPVLLPAAADAAGKRRNLERSLWMEGQIAVDFPKARLRLPLQWRCRRAPGLLPAAPGGAGAPPIPTARVETTMLMPISLSLPVAEHEPIAPHLTEAARELLPIPPTAQSTMNIDSMANFLPLIEPVMLAARPGRICEIGMGSGALSRTLVPWCQANGAQLSVVDPAASPEKLGAASAHVRLYDETSERYFQRDAFANIYFIDGDHNHYTVSRELEAIERASDRHPNEPLVLFLHDVGWPNGRRDMFYALRTVPNAVYEGRLAPDRCMPLLDLAGQPDLGLSYEDTMEGIARCDGGPDNGVLTAVEAFVGRRPQWAFFWLPALYGLGVAWRRDRVPDGLASALEELHHLVDRVRPLAATLELNRLRLLGTINLSGKIWEENVGVIQEQQTSMRRLQDHIESLDASLRATRIDLAVALAEQARRDGFADLVLCGAGGLQGLGPVLVPGLHAAGFRLSGYYDHLPVGALETLCDVPVLDRSRLRPSGERAFIIVSPGYGRDIRETLKTVGAEHGSSPNLYLPGSQQSS